LTKEIKFEDKVEELEKITKALEDGDTSLDDAIKYYEKGIEIAGECQKILNKVEQKVVKLLKDKDGTIIETPFDEGK